MFTSDRRSTLSGKAGEIAEELERRLVLGMYKFAEPITISELADEMSASKQPVSAAIAHLRTLGYLEIIPQVGCKVVSPTPNEIEDFFLAVSKLEGTVASFAANRHSDSEADTLKHIAARPAPKSLDELAARRAYIDTLNDFHDQIWKMARSPLLKARTENFRQLSIFYLWQGAPTMAPASAKYFIRQRREIAERICKRDATAAERMMAEHIAAKPQVSGLLRTE